MVSCLSTVLGHFGSSNIKISLCVCVFPGNFDTKEQIKKTPSDFIRVLFFDVDESLPYSVFRQSIPKLPPISLIRESDFKELSWFRF